MGTNFYYKIPLSKRKIKELQDLITEEPDFDTLMYELEEAKENHCIHLGKRSAGWQFLWDFHKGKYYDSSLTSIKQFLATAGGYIESEYCKKISVDSFFGEEIATSLYKDENHVDYAEYQKQHPEDTYYSNFIPSAEEFTSEDGLRFCKTSDFC